MANAGRAAGKPSHIEVLDGLRGMAILMVLMHHFALFGGYQPGTWLDTFTVALAGAGWAGVDLFFVLSGFLITRILLDADREQQFFLNFYARRTLRIFPLYYVTLGLFFVVTPFVARHLGWIPPSAIQSRGAGQREIYRSQRNSMFSNRIYRGMPTIVLLVVAAIIEFMAIRAFA